MITILLKIFLAHLIGDFFLQPKKWIKDKEKKQIKSVWLYAHIAVHIVLMFLFIWDISYTKLILSIGAIHLIIDAFKLLLQNEKNKRVIFLLDQVFHIFTILLLTQFFYPDTLQIDWSISNQLLLSIICVSFLTFPTSIIMQTIFSKWNISKLNKNNDSLKDAGMYIGVLERVLVFVFIVAGHWEAVGFLITAKSVFRFGDLSASKERQLTEYVLIGTLISFSFAIITGFIYINLLPNV